MSDNLTDFLAPRAVPEPSPVEVNIEPATPAESEAPEPSVEPAEPDPPVENVPGQHQVPLAALEAERKQRQNWRGQFDLRDEQARAAETRVQELQARLAELEKAAKPAPPPPPPPAQIPDPIADPAGYAGYIQQAVFDERLNLSEMQFQAANPGVDTKAIAARFLEEVQKDPRLGSMLRQQPHPYAWVDAQLKRIDAAREIGDDPAAWRAKAQAEWRAAAEAEIRAQVTAEIQGASQPVTKTPRTIAALPTSLAGAGSASPDAGAAQAAGPSFDALFPKR